MAGEAAILTEAFVEKPRKCFLFWEPDPCADARDLAQGMVRLWERDTLSQTMEMTIQLPLLSSF